MTSIIAFLTDFGPRGAHYVASMKAVILSINPNVNIIDLSHNISAYSIIEASYLIRSTYRYFPKGTIFIIVVDPGVGSSREILALKTGSGYYFVGPNNGIFSNAFNDDIIEECYFVQNDYYYNKPVSDTFHGRDIMSPIGAYISKGISLEKFGPRFNLRKLIILPIEYEIKSDDNEIIGLIQYIDSFGNGTTNIPIKDNVIIGTSIILKNQTPIRINFENKKIEFKYVTHFADVPKNSFLLLKGSSGFLEISKNQANASKEIGFSVGDKITVTIHQ